MLATELIHHKRHGRTHTTEDLKKWMAGYLAGDVTDYQMSAWLMAVCIHGMTTEEMRTWTELTWKSGSSFPKAPPGEFWVDKHSTGGVGDKTSLILVPLVKVASEKLLGAGRVRIPMVSGRGLGHTGGTLDKLESVPGFKTGLSLADGVKALGENGYVMMGQTAEIAPADKRLYALRDVTGTVASVPLIVASILGKKLSESLNGIVFDVKFGEGAFMPTLAEAKALATALAETARACGVEARALLTNMNEPLGRAIGNRLEVEECAAYLRGQPSDSGLHVLVLALAEEMLVLAGKGKISTAEARATCERIVQEGAAFAEFRRMFAAQGGDWEKFESERPRLSSYEVIAPRSGVVEKISALTWGKLLVKLGGGRRKFTDVVDPDVGILMQAKVGDRLKRGDRVATVFYRQPNQLALIEEAAYAGIELGDSPVARTQWVEGRI